MAADASGGDGRDPDDPRRRLRAACEANHGMLLDYARRLLRGREVDAPDFVNDTMSRFLVAFPEGPPPDLRAGIWMARTLKNSLISDWRKRAVRRNALADPALRLVVSPQPAGSPDSPMPPTPIDAVMDRVTFKDFVSKVDELSPRLREAYQLHLQGYNRAQIAQRLHLTENAVGKRLYDARRRLLALLAGDGPGGGDQEPA
jgi:RNA polymerase sigma factor (sigma-70 family)